MARALIVGCGCRGRELGRELSARGWQVRGTSRDEGALEGIAEAGLEPALADPDRPGTILELCGDVAVVVWLLASATGEPGLLEAIHGPRLERLVAKLVDTPVRRFVYEAAGTVGAELIHGGRGIVESASETWRIPVAFIDSAPGDSDWAAQGASVVAGLLAG